MIARGYSPGELIILGFEGPTLPSSTAANIQKENIGQVILFAQNFKDPEQLITLTDSIQALSTNLPMMISVDQEGGRVQRFINGFTRIPSAKKIGDLDQPSLAFEMSKIIARELFSAGIQMNFTPVADINTNAANPVIGDRAYGSEEERVSKMVTAVVRGHLQENVEPCVKHFPGHGDTHLDSHLALPTVTTPLDVLKAREWIPFHKAMKSGCRFLMSAHLLLPHLDPTHPGTFSKTFLKKFLRDELHYQGVVVSDDMQMGAVIDNFGAEEAPILALEAGCDLLCYRHEPNALAAIESIKRAIASGRLNQDKLIESIDRVRKVRAEIKLAKNLQKKSERIATIGQADHVAYAAKFSIL